MKLTQTQIEALWDPTKRPKKTLEVLKKHGLLNADDTLTKEGLRIVDMVRVRTASGLTLPEALKQVQAKLKATADENR